MATAPSDEQIWIPTRRSLLERLRKESSNADWQIFFDTYWRLIYRTAAKAGLKPQECEDVVQETVLSVFKKVGEFEYMPEKGHFKGWLFRLTSWRIKDHLRGVVRRDLLISELPLDDVLTDPELAPEIVSFDWDAEWEVNLQEAALDQLKNRVDPLYYQIFHLSDLEGWKGHQVARLLKVSLAVVYTAKHRVREQLKSIVRNLKAHPEQFSKLCEKH
jgi:RNA polymerase sigma factor (sigma-70 family)